MSAGPGEAVTGGDVGAPEGLGAGCGFPPQAQRPSSRKAAHITPMSTVINRLFLLRVFISISLFYGL
jgi:hypothetical protein